MGSPPKSQEESKVDAKCGDDDDNKDKVSAEYIVFLIQHAHVDKFSCDLCILCRTTVIVAMMSPCHRPLTCPKFCHFQMKNAVFSMLIAQHCHFPAGNMILDLEARAKRICFSSERNNRAKAKKRVPILL